MSTTSLTAITTQTGTTTAQESQSVSTSKIGGRPTGITKTSIGRRKTLVADAVDECAIEIASLKTKSFHKIHKLGNGTKCRVPQGALEKVALKVCEKYNLERSEIYI
jgi:hypothetical protein